MAVSGISTLGVKFGYAVESVAGSRPTSGYTQLTRINSIGEIPMSVETIDSSALEDLVSKSIPGRQEGGTVDVTVNLTDDTRTEWKNLITAYEGLTGGKGMWFEITNPSLSFAYFIKAQPPKKLPVPAHDQNGLETITIQLTIEDVVDETKVEIDAE